MKQFMPRPGLAMMLMLATGSITTQATAQTYTLDEYIATQNQPDFDWPLKNSFWSRTPFGTSPAERMKVTGHELNGIWLNDCSTPNSEPSGWANDVEYFPMLPPHMTPSNRSTALIFGETLGDLAPSGDAVDRYIKFDFSSRSGDFSGEDDAFEIFDFDYKQNWTLHIAVSPDQDSSDSRGWETIFDVGSTAGSLPSRVVIDCDVDATNTEFRVRRFGKSGSTQVVTTASLTIANADVAAIDSGTDGTSSIERRWYQVIVQYYTFDVKDLGDDQEDLKIIVNYEDDSTGVISTDFDNKNSNQGAANDGTVAHIGADLDESNCFHGAMSNFAIWNEELDSTELEDLSDAFGVTKNSPDPRSAQTIDFNAEPRYFIWTRPVNENMLSGSSRSLKSWQDPIWDEEGVYPMVRMFTNNPDVANSHSVPPDVSTYSYSAQSGTTPRDIGHQVANWIEYTKVGIETHARDLDMDKSLGDTNALMLLFQNFGKPNDSCEYEDLGASRSLMYNWRDVPAVWREDSDHSTSVTLGTEAEIASPFYREGMSINAFNSVDIFKTLQEDIDSKGLPQPARLYFDSESFSNIFNAWSSGTGVQGWWQVFGNGDERLNDKSHWAPHTENAVSTNNFDSLYELEDAFTDGTDYDTSKGPSHSDNNEITIALDRFARDQYDQAFGLGLLVPAIQELDNGSSIRLSEYDMVAAGEPTYNEQYPSRKLDRSSQFVSPLWFDNPAPVLYPLTTNKLRVYESSTSDTLFQQWEDNLDGVNKSTTLATPPLDSDRPNDNGSLGASESQVIDDGRIMYVERSKFKINGIYKANGYENGSPMVPWLPYPETNAFPIEQRFDRSMNGCVGSEDTIINDVNKDDVARIAVFATRHGVREFIFWGDTADEEDTASIEGIEYVIDAIRKAISKPLDFTHTNTSGTAGFGVPDGCRDSQDVLYFQDIYYAGDLEADISGSTSGVPDGIVNATDADYFSFNFAYDSCP